MQFNAIEMMNEGYIFKMSIKLLYI